MFPVKPASGVQLDWSDSINIGLRAKWLCNDGGGVGFVTDLANKIPANFTNSPAWKTGPFGQTLQFGSTAYLNSVDCPALRCSTNITLSCWMFAISANASNSVLIQKRDNSNGGAGHNYSLWFTSGRQLFSQWRNSGGAYDTYTDGQTLSLNTVYHVGLTLDDRAKKLVFYVNGRASSTFTTLYSPGADAGTPVQIGNYAFNSAVYGLNGLLDLPTIWNRTLTPDEMLRLATDPFAGVKVASIRNRSRSITFNLTGLLMKRRRVV
jgi:hypothetical protein